MLSKPRRELDGNFRLPLHPWSKQDAWSTDQDIRTEGSDNSSHHKSLQPSNKVIYSMSGRWMRLEWSITGLSGRLPTGRHHCAAHQSHTQTGLTHLMIQHTNKHICRLEKKNTSPDECHKQSHRSRWQRRPIWLLIGVFVSTAQLSLWGRPVIFLKW